VGASVTFTATVTSATAGTITGTVTFLDGTTQIGTGAVGAGGVATFATSALAQGSHSITAQYGGDSNYTGSTSTAVTQVVNAAAPIGTTTALSASATTATFGTNITFTATVSSMSAISKKAQISAAITGTVTFLDGSTPIGTGSVGTNGVATFSTTALAVGSHSITAQYGGDSTYNGSTSSPVTVVVNAATTISTMTALTASSTSATSGTNITFTATVTASAIAGKKSAALAAITGSVTFLDGTTQIGTGSVGANGVATYSTSALAAGSHSITAQYGGDPNYSGSTSPAVQVTITASGTFTLSANPASVTVTKSIPGTSTITVTPANGFNQNVALSCSGLPSGFSCTLAPPSVTPNGSPVTSTLTITDGLVPTSAPARKVVAALWPGSRGTGSGTGTFGPPARVALFALGGELMLVGLLFTRRKKLLAHSSGRLAFALLVGAIAITFMTGCAGSLPTQTTTVTVSATAGTQTVTTSLNVTLPN
jgi:predicted secreted protein